MGQALARQPMTGAEFLAWDSNEPLRHEFFRGEVYLMAGAEARHNKMQGNLYIALRTHLRGSACETFISQMKLRIEAADCFFCPDVMVTCGAADASQPLIKSEAVLVVEVLSPSTAACDRGAKFAAYRQAPSLAEYLLIDIDTRRCNLYRKGVDGLWVLHPFEPEQTLHLASVELNIGPENLWAEVEPAAAG